MFQLRLTEDELAAWRAEAESQGLPLARWIRDRCSEGEGRVSREEFEKIGTPVADLDFEFMPKTMALALPPAGKLCPHGRWPHEWCQRCRDKRP